MLDTHSYRTEASRYEQLTAALAISRVNIATVTSIRKLVRHLHVTVARQLVSPHAAATRTSTKISTKHVHYSVNSLPPTRLPSNRRVSRLDSPCNSAQTNEVRARRAPSTKVPPLQLAVLLEDSETTKRQASPLRTLQFKETLSGALFTLSHLPSSHSHFPLSPDLSPFFRHLTSQTSLDGYLDLIAIPQDHIHSLIQQLPTTKSQDAFLCCCLRRWPHGCCRQGPERRGNQRFHDHRPDRRDLRLNRDHPLNHHHRGRCLRHRRANPRGDCARRVSVRVFVPPSPFPPSNIKIK